jgi:hypothetical protein
MATSKNAKRNLAKAGNKNSYSRKAASLLSN